MNTLKDVKRMIQELDEKTGLEGALLSLEVSNGKKELGSFRFQAYRSYFNNEITKCTPIGFRFSKLILSCDQETLFEIVKHEYAHYMATVRFNDNCYHDKRFKAMCAEIGADANEPTFTNKSVKEQSIKMAKYTLTCESCGHVFTYSRKCSTLEAAKNGNATCSCGCSSFIFKQNH